MQLFSLPLQLPLQQSTSFLFLACQLQSVHLETFVSLFSSQLLGTEVACRDLAPSLPSMKTDTLGKQVRCCGCWCPPSVLAALTTLGCVLALASGKIPTSALPLPVGRVQSNVPMMCTSKRYARNARVYRDSKTTAHVVVW